MKERPQFNASSDGNDGAWPAMDARWPNATWMSPWEFQDDAGAAGEGEVQEDEPDVEARH